MKYMLVTKILFTYKVQTRYGASSVIEYFCC